MSFSFLFLLIVCEVATFDIILVTKYGTASLFILPSFPPSLLPSLPLFILPQYNHSHDRAIPAVMKKQLMDVVQRGPLAAIDELEKDLIWRFRLHLFPKPVLLVPF